MANFGNKNSGEFVLPRPSYTRNQHKTYLNFCQTIIIFFLLLTYTITIFSWQLLPPLIIYSSNFELGRLHLFYRLTVFLCRYHIFLKFNPYFYFYRLQLNCTCVIMTPAELSTGGLISN